MNTNDILVSKWGYDQTNVEFYKVIKTTAKFATIVKLQTITDHNDDMTYIATPTANTKGEVLRRKIVEWDDKQFIYINTYERAYIASQKDIEFGVKGTAYA